MAQKVILTATGGVDGLQVIDEPVGAPGPGEIRLRQTAIGVNFVDIYYRSGLYPLALPAVLGVEAAGVVEAVGAAVDGLAVGDRVGYAGLPLGGYAEQRLLPAVRAIRLPDEISDRLAAASFLRGLTAHMLLTHTYPVTAGTVVLVQAAAGGLGIILTRWAKALGAVVIGTVGSAAKAERARAAGADHLIIGRTADIAAEVMALTEGRGADVAYDGIGGTTLLKTLACVRRFGTVASIGQAAGPIPPLAVSELGPGRSLSLARPSVLAYAADPARYHRAAADLLAVMARGIVAEIGADYPLAAVAEAQSALETGQTSGSLLLRV